MLKPLLLSISFLLMLTCAKAQDEQNYFNLTFPLQKLSGTLYNKLQVLDRRSDTTFIGYIQSADNKIAKIFPVGSLKAQFQHVFSCLTDTAAKPKKELLLRVQRFRFLGFNSYTNKRGYFIFAAKFYARDNDVYQEIGAIDTTIMLNGANYRLLNNAKALVNSFITTNVIKPPAGPALTYNALIRWDTVEVRPRAYHVERFVDGLYENYTSFKAQKPDKQFVIEGEDLTKATITTSDKDGDITEVNPKNIYALVYLGQAFISSAGKFFPLTKENGDLHFTGLARVGPNGGEMAAMGMMFGVLGGAAVASIPKNAMFEMKIEPYTGEFIRLREVKKVR